MVMNNQLVDAFNNCIDRLNRGDSIDNILSDYPDLATQLHPMLVAGLVVKKAHFPLTDVSTAQENIAPQIEDAINNTFGGGNLSMNWLGLILIVLLIGSIIGGIFTLNRDDDVSELGATPTMLQESPTTTVTATATATMTALPTAEQSMPVVTVIEGPVSNIQGNMITIYDQDIQLALDDPRLSVMQLGDVLRVETSQDSQSIVALDITFVNVIVVVNASGQIWRGDDCSNPPPEWVDVDTNSWFIQCNVGNSNNNSTNSSNDNDNDSDDDDD